MSIITIVVVQLYNSRKTVLKKTRESEMWSEIDYKYMTEESEGEDDTIKQHKLPWRSRSKFYNRHVYMFLVCCSFVVFMQNWTKLYVGWTRD